MPRYQHSPQGTGGLGHPEGGGRRRGPKAQALGIPRNLPQWTPFVSGEHENTAAYSLPVLGRNGWGWPSRRVQVCRQHRGSVGTGAQACREGAGPQAGVSPLPSIYLEQCCWTIDASRLWPLAGSLCQPARQPTTLQGHDVPPTLRRHLQARQALQLLFSKQHTGICPNIGLHVPPWSWLYDRQEALGK